ncbi:MAG TPA: class I SAM-dependent methyltransferase, partial [Dehalococcoidia bacterium]|nr:class I SAM-dependent methyltransferase [Dehalococcoidia bacterium]
MNAVERYAQQIDAVAEQQARLGRSVPDRWSRAAPIFRADPRRPFDETLSAIAAYLQPDDVLVDVGGGAGRLGLPLALRCREVVNVEPAPGMQEQFAACAAEAGITNVRAVQADWLAAPPVDGDVALAAHVTYFVHEIEPFVRKLSAAARRRVIVVVASVPPPNMNAALFRLLLGEELKLVPAHRELLPVLWELGLLPDVRVLRQPPTVASRPNPDQTAAIQAAAASAGFQDDQHAVSVIEQHFATLFRTTPEGYVPAWQPASRTMLITWET